MNVYERERERLAVAFISWKEIKIKIPDLIKFT